MKLLVVDDQKEVLTLASLFLTRLGHVVLTAQNIATAEAVLLNSEVEGILIDLNLDSARGGTPAGEAWIGALKQRGFNGKIWAMSAARDARIQTAVMNAGATGWIQKPLELIALKSIC